MTCVVVGGGYAGIHAVTSIQKYVGTTSAKQTLRIILIDKNPYHLRKVLLFKPAVGEQEITVPLKKIFPQGVEIIQATVTNIETEHKRIQYQDSLSQKHCLKYDSLVLAVGSRIRKPNPAQGGIVLSDIESAREIQQKWRSNLYKARYEPDSALRSALMTIAVAGAGISGMETSAELAHSVRADAKALGLDPSEVKIVLLNSQNRLFKEGPAKVGRGLEHALVHRGVTIKHECKALKEAEGIVTLSNGETLPVGLCIWTLGLLPNPSVKNFGLPLTSEGCVIVDASYRVKGLQDVYCIGDCAHIIDPTSGKPDGKTCKEATAQAATLGRIILADRKGRRVPSHKSYMDFFCISLGPGQGIVWIRRWGLNLTVSGKLGWFIRKWTWDMASLIKR
ncbi:NAD(P)/FAD-dependent oxidoreductase [Sporosarcina sp. Te-1]|uniref:NAD(P)/FAD-dependent oxidoreductase n=1 Tax=Sporosarcina sp. Te-1 TaxID=2818390 RepID=UPI001FB0E561|nr:FAD-dependent oxidoreductase [Sporosarcina sp. Te-1]